MSLRQIRRKRQQEKDDILGDEDNSPDEDIVETPERLVNVFKLLEVDSDDEEESQKVIEPVSELDSDDCEEPEKFELDSDDDEEPQKVTESIELDSDDDEEPTKVTEPGLRFVPLDSDSDDDLSELLQKSTLKKPLIEVLYSEDYDDEQEEPDTDKIQPIKLVSDEDNEPEAVTEPQLEETNEESASSKPKKQKRKRNRRKQKRSVTSHGDDEVSRAVAEVNQMLGAPEVIVVKAAPVDKKKKVFTTLKVDHKLLNPNTELTQLLGPPTDEPRKERRKFQKHHIIPLGKIIPLNMKGLSMEKIEECDGVKFFKFVCSPKYASSLRTLVALYRLGASPQAQGQKFPLDTLEGSLVMAEKYFKGERYEMAVELLESALSYVQRTFAPGFSYTDGKTRLDYSILENRAFHILLLQYAHLLSNKACHRTALEIAKLMLNLDPKDPLGVILIVDTLAIRAREHQWLLDMYDQLMSKRQLHRLFHMLYSRALAKYNLHFHSATPDADLEIATDYLIHAIVKFPDVAEDLLTRCGRLRRDSPRITQNASMESSTPTKLRQLQSLYAAFVFFRWQEKKADNWLLRTYEKLVEQHANDPLFKETLIRMLSQRRMLFRNLPVQIRRHIAIITPMSQLLVEGAVPPIEEAIMFNPFPEDQLTIDEHGIFYNSEESTRALNRVLHSFLNSVRPGYDQD